MDRVEVLDDHGRIVPTADTLVSFEVHGPARLVGVGNGDPSSHENDRFVDAVSTLPVADWRGRIAPADTEQPSEPGTLPPLTALGNWKAPLPRGGELYDLCASFELAEVSASTSYHLYLPSLGTKTTLWVNGHLLATRADTSVSGPDLVLDHSVLAAGANRVQLIAAPFADGKNHIPDRTRLGAVQALRQAEPWQRRAFNGLAEVTVQSAGGPGSVMLEARAEGLLSKPLILAGSSGPVPR